MQAAPIHRWGLGFIALRWRHVFWLLPLIGGLLGFGLQYRKLYGPTAIGLVRVSPLVLSPTAPRPPDLAKLLKSDGLLFNTVYTLDLPKRWSVHPGPSVVRLRDMIHSEAIPGTPFVEIRVSDTNRNEAVEIWNTLARFANQHVIDSRSAAANAKLAANQSTLRALELDLEEKQHKLMSALQQRASATTNPASSNLEESKGLEQLRADLEAAEAAFDKESKRLFPSPIICGGIIFDPIHIHEAPPVLSLHRWDSMRPLIHHTGIGLSIAVLLTAPVAYLLELLLPRRQQEFHPED